MRALAVLALLALAACGAEGDPQKPAPRPGVTLSGQVSAGVVVK